MTKNSKREKNFFSIIGLYLRSEDNNRINKVQHNAAFSGVA